MSDGTTLPLLDPVTDPRGSIVYAVENNQDKKITGGGANGFATTGPDGKLDATQRPTYTPEQTVMVEGPTYAPVKSDAGKWLICNSASAITITIRGAVFDEGDKLNFIQEGIGQVVIQGGTGDDYFDLKSKFDSGMTSQYAVAHVYVKNDTEGYRFGDLDPL